MVNKIVKTWLLVIWMLLTEAMHLEVDGCISSIHPAVTDTSNRSRKGTAGWSNVKITCPEKVSDYQGVETRYRGFPPILNGAQKQKKMAGTFAMPWEKWGTEAWVVSQWTISSPWGVPERTLPSLFYRRAAKWRGSVYTYCLWDRLQQEDLCLGLNFFLFTPFSLAVSWGWQHSTLCKLKSSGEKQHTDIHPLQGTWH